MIPFSGTEVSLITAPECLPLLKIRVDQHNRCRIGHDLIGYLDDDPKSTFILNNYFENDFDNYMKGKVVYDLYDLAEAAIR